MRHSFATETPAIPICITATGFVTGRIPVCESTVPLASTTLGSSNDSLKGRHNETFAPLEQEGAAHRRSCQFSKKRRGRIAAGAADSTYPDGLHTAFLSGVGSGFLRRHIRSLSAGRTRHLRLPCRLLLAGASAGSL